MPLDKFLNASGLIWPVDTSILRTTDDMIMAICDMYMASTEAFHPMVWNRFVASRLRLNIFVTVAQSHGRLIVALLSQKQARQITHSARHFPKEAVNTRRTTDMIVVHCDIIMALLEFRFAGIWRIVLPGQNLAASPRRFRSRAELSLVSTKSRFKPGTKWHGINLAF